ncbi:DNA helicase B [Sardina pilchardus]|uniref:DNA helicase B n=1 Tax=Sardina pilchardus TaxID=27697 RepID=UPI002E127F03
MSAATSSPRGRVLVGFILPPKQEAQRNQDEGSDPEDDEEEEDPEFPDMAEMESLSNGGRMFQSSVSPRLEVDFQILGSTQTLRLEGRFPLTNPWWQITCRVGQPRKGRAVVQGFPSYALRSDLTGEDSRSVVFLFLNACGVSPEHVTQFNEWLSTETEVGLRTLPALLEEFADVEKYKTAASHMKDHVSKSVAGVCVRAAKCNPLVMKHLPTLLPRQFKELLGMGKKKDQDTRQDSAEVGLAEGLLDHLEEIIQTQVWKLGFSYILYKELHLIRCEARLEAFAACGLFRGIPELQRHALQVYGELKRQCQLSGSTYVELRDLEGLLCAEVPELSVWAAVHFMKEQGVVVLERQRVALRNLHSYETGISERLARLTRSVDEGGAKPWRIDLDVRRVLREAQEERLRARAEAEAGKNTPGEQANGAGASEKDGEEVLETSQDATGVTEDRPSDDPMCGHGERPTTQGIHLNGGSSWDDLNFDLKHSIPSQEDVAPGPEEPTRDPPAEIPLDPDQVRAAQMICSNSVTVISGKGGCGKTTVVSLVFKAAMQQHDREMEEVLKACEDFQNDSGHSPPEDQAKANPPGVGKESKQEEERRKKEEEKKKEEEEAEKLQVLLTAPTGRAAGLLTKRTGFTAYTMHQVLFSYMHWRRVKDKGGEKGGGERPRWKFRRVRVLVVDEGSLVSVQILHSLLAMLTSEAQLQKFVLLGDVRQLPSIEPGNALYDLFHSLRRVQWSIEMRTNHRAESGLIVDNAGHIANMGQKRTFYQLNFDAFVDMNCSPEVPGDDRRFIFVRVSQDDCALQDAILFLLQRGAGLQDHKISQFIAFRRNDCALINELCCKHYGGHATKNHRNRIDFRVGDKICCTKNNHITDRSHERGPAQAPPPPETAEQQLALLARPTQPGGCCPLPSDLCPLTFDPLEGTSDRRTPQTEGRERKRKEEEEKEPVKERLCNGEIFYITEDVTVEEDGRPKRRYLTLDDGQGRVLCVLFRELQRLCRIQHAWARTIHTFQGSEAETIVYVVGSGVAQDWRHVYTAVTRGQKRVYVVSTDADFEKAIRGHVRKRNTRLGQQVRELVAEQQTGEEDLLTQSSFTQPCPGTPSRQAPGFGPPQASQTPSQTPGPSSMLKDIKKEEDGCLQDDINFSQAYNWCSPMECAEDHANVPCEPPVMGSAEAAVVKEENPWKALSDPAQSPLGIKRASDSQGWNTPPKQSRTLSADSPTGASSLGLLTLGSPSPAAPVVKHLFPREAGENTITISPVIKFRARVGLSQRFAAGDTAERPSSGHPEEASPFRRAPGSASGLETSNSLVPLAMVTYPELSAGPSEDTLTASETCLEEDLAFTQAYSWPPMSGDDDTTAVPHGSPVEDGFSQDFLQKAFGLK